MLGRRHDKKKKNKLILFLEHLTAEANVQDENTERRKPA